MPVPIHVVDAFTSAPFAGNPAAVCVLPEPADSDWMQSVAREMNLSETAFVVPGAPAFGLRWFTPAVEIDLCGHATLASAHVLFETGTVDGSVAFDTRSGRLVCRGADGRIEMDFPAVDISPVSIAAGLTDALGTAEVVGAYDGGHHLYVELASAATVRTLEPDLGRVAAIGSGVVTVTAASDTGDADFVSRVFGPGVGIDEDPVTGSAHCGLAPFWAARLGRPDVVGYQASARGGTVRCRVVGDRVLLAGDAVTVLRGELQA